jgi:hypothetical protein
VNLKYHVLNKIKSLFDPSSFIAESFVIMVGDEINILAAL